MALIRSPEFHIDATIVCSREANVGSWRLYSRSAQDARHRWGRDSNSFVVGLQVWNVEVTHLTWNHIYWHCFWGKTCSRIQSLANLQSKAVSHWVWQLSSCLSDQTHQYQIQKHLTALDSNTQCNGSDWASKMSQRGAQTFSLLHLFQDSYVLLRVWSLTGLHDLTYYSTTNNWSFAECGNPYWTRTAGAFSFSFVDTFEVLGVLHCPSCWRLPCSYKWYGKRMTHSQSS